MFESIGMDLFITFVSYLLGFGTKKALEIVSDTLPTRRLWRLKGNQAVHIVTANTPENTRIDGNEYAVTGYLSDYLSADRLTSHLRNVFKGLQFSINMESYFNYDSAGDNLIIIGGPVNNPLARKVMGEIDLPFEFQGYSLVNKFKIKEYSPVISEDLENRFIEKDYGLLVNIGNPFDHNRSSRIVIIAGCRILGCYAGARFLTQPYRKIRQSLREQDIRGRALGGKRNFALVVEASGHGHRLVGFPKLIDYEFF